MSDSVGMWVRADWRRRFISLVALAIVAGVSFAVAVTAFAGARRTASSFDRLREETRAYDHGVVVDAPGASPTDDDSYDEATIERIRQLPQIESSGGLVIYIASIPGADSEMALNVPEDDTLGTHIAADRVLRGRMPAVERVDEVAVNEVAVQQIGVDVGSVLTLETLSPDQQQRLLAGDPSTFDQGPLGPELQLRVVGVLRGPSDVMGRSDPTAYGTPAFDREYRGQVAYAYRILVVRRADGYTGAEFDDAVGSVLSGFRLGMFDAELENKPAERTTRTLAVGLAVFALIAGLVSILVVNQAVTRHVNGADADHPALSALGFTRPQRLWGLVAMVAPATIGAALVTTVASNAGSALMPVGLARRIEPEPGLRFDALATALGAGVLVATMLLTATIAAMSATRRQRVSEQTSKQPSRIAVALSALGLGPVSATGIRLAFDRRSPALPVRSTMIAVAAALAVLAGSLTFSASLDRLEASPERWGYGWDLMLDSTESEVEAFMTTLARDPAIDGVSLLQANFTYMNDRGRVEGVRAYGMGARSGEVGYALVSGAQPDGSDEVVIGPALADKADLGVGDVVDVAVCPCTGDQAQPAMTSVRVVGTALFPEADDGTFNNALGFSERGYSLHVGGSEATRAVVSVAADHDAASVARDLDRQFPDAVSAYSYPSRPGEVANLAGLRSFPRALAAVASLLGAAVLLNLLVATRNRRRRELATLWSLGLTARGLRGCVVWQSLGVVAVALVLGTVAGVAAGASVWVATTDGIGVATDINRPLSAIGLWSVAVLAAALALGTLAGAGAGRLDVAKSLRHE